MGHTKVDTKNNMTEDTQSTIREGLKNA